VSAALPARLALLLGAGLLIAAPATARTRVLKFGTVAPKGTIWAQAADEMGAAFTQASDGALKVRTYAGVVGDEPTIVRKMRVGQLDGAVLTSSGLGLLAKEPMVLQLPMFFDSYEELDEVRAAIEPELNRILEARGFVVLAWGDAGMFHFFTKQPAAGPADIKGMRMWMWAHDPHGVQIFNEIGFEPVVLSSIDLVPSLQTGLINSFPATATAALVLQSYRLAPNMIEIDWTPVIGATVITKESWERVPAELRTELLAACAEIGARFRSSVRAQDQAALAAMVERGLKVHRPSAAQLKAWRAKADHSLAYVRANALPTELVDKVVRLRDEARARRAAPSAK